MVYVLKEDKTADLAFEASNELYFGPTGKMRVAALHVRLKRRNVYITATDLTGAVLGSISTKTFVHHRKKRKAPHVLEIITQRLMLLFKVYRIDAIRFFVKVKKKYLVQAVAQAFKSSEIPVSFIMDLVPTPHNGSRGKRRKRR